MKTMKVKVGEAYDVLKEKFGYKNKLAAPRLQKVVVNVGTGSAIKRDKNKNTFIIDRISRITGQKPTVRGAKKAIASFKVRQNDPIGVVVTLRGEQMYSFLDKLVHVALPRTKDFRGLNRSNVNELGNMSIGIREHTIFPETSDEEIRDVFGMSLTIVTTAADRDQAMALFEYLGFPLKKDDEAKKKRIRRKK
ncbi:MAG: 50S ribosomal protein L5, partial [Candidatus Pacebacteria bacterium]|nr:50S ribosomal protein L5 [Candidatus Paceibacterota bacterium]